MSESLVEWRRGWSPDLSALPWTRFTIDGTAILLKSHFTPTSYSVLVYDYSSVWQEVCEGGDTNTKAKRCNPHVEAPLSKLLQHLEELLKEGEGSAKYSLRYDRGDEPAVSIRLSSSLAQGVPFSWTLNLSRASDETASTHLTIPLLTMVSELMRREKELEKIIRKKEEEIEDYKSSGAKVSRKHKLTQVFDGKAFDREMIKSSAFRKEIECSGQKAFNGSGQEIYKEVMVTRAWLKRPLDTDDGSNEDDVGGGDVSDIPSAADTLSPVKSSPSISPSKASPASTGKDTELLRREALERRLQEEKAKQQSKKKKKKPF